ncbi:unnamed protein product, partial [Mesorhabditis belari]|uniref:EB domain-containing protein n=1 Tax=Mesorhabditis belari TaxID=2138241 RepID=A0AAF3JAI7_9BILA
MFKLVVLSLTIIFGVSAFGEVGQQCISAKPETGNGCGKGNQCAYTKCFFVRGVLICSGYCTPITPSSPPPRSCNTNADCLAGEYCPQKCRLNWATEVCSGTYCAPIPPTTAATPTTTEINRICYTNGECRQNEYCDSTNCRPNWSEGCRGVCRCGFSSAQSSLDLSPTTQNNDPIDISEETSIPPVSSSKTAAGCQSQAESEKPIVVAGEEGNASPTLLPFPTLPPFPTFPSFTFPPFPSLPPFPSFSLPSLPPFPSFPAFPTLPTMSTVSPQNLLQCLFESGTFNPNCLNNEAGSPKETFSCYNQTQCSTGQVCCTAFELLSIFTPPSQQQQNGTCQPFFCPFGQIPL